MIKIALISAWHVHFEAYVDRLKKNNDCEITVMWDEDPVRGGTWSQKISCDFEPCYEALLLRRDVDAVMITAPTNLHRELIVKAANAGKHIFTEKVLALSIADCLEIKDAVEKNGVKLVVCLLHRIYPRHLFVKAAVDSRLLGEVTSARIRYAHNGALCDWLPKHFYSTEQCGGGAMIDLGAHPMYLLPWLLGKPKSVVSIFNSFTDKAVEDNAVSVIEFENKAIAVCETSFVSTHSPYSVELSGTKGALLLTGLCGDSSDGLKYNIGDGWVTPDNLPEEHAFPTDMLINAILHDEQIPFTIDDSIMLSRLMECAYEANATGKRTEIQ